MTDPYVPPDPPLWPGSPSGPWQPPPPPRADRPLRPHAGWWMVWPAFLVAAALAFLLEGGTSNFHGYSFDSALVAPIPVDGRAHDIPDLATDKGIVWTADSTSGWPMCRWRDPGLDRGGYLDSYLQGPGDYGSHSAIGSFPVGSGHVVLTCRADVPGDHSGTVLVGPDPRFGHRLGHAVLSILLAGMLGLVGIIGLLGMALLWISHAPRTHTVGTSRLSRPGTP